MRTLLIIDDNSSVRESLHFLLMQRGYSVLLADSGPAGLALAAANEVDAALVDVQMAGMNGLEACQLLREQFAAAGRTTPFWMMTGGRSPELARRCSELGAVGLLGKPFDVPQLIQQLEAHLGPVTPPESREPPAP
jgi:CheY-like chemotaxis protein